MVQVKKIKLKGSSLLESIFAMAIVMICFGIGTNIYIRVTQSDRQQARLVASKLLSTWAERSKKEKRLISESVTENNLRLEKNIRPFPGANGLQHMQLLARGSEGELLAEYNELIIVK